MEGWALPVLAVMVSSLVTGLGTLFALGRKVITKTEHTELCRLHNASTQKDITHLERWQDRIEVKIDESIRKQEEALRIIYKLNGGG